MDAINEFVDHVEPLSSLSASSGPVLKQEPSEKECSPLVEANLIGDDRLTIGGYVYRKLEERDDETEWQCVKYYQQRQPMGCSARALISNTPQCGGQRIHILRGPSESPHNHPPDPGDMKIDKENTGTEKSSTCGLQEQTQGLTSTNKCTAYSRALDFLTDPVRYKQFLLKFAEKPLFYRKYVHEALDGIWSFPCSGVSRSAVCSVIQSNRDQILADLKELFSDTSEDINSPPASSPSSSSSLNTESYDVPNSDNPSEFSPLEFVADSYVVKSEKMDDYGLTPIETPVLRSYTPTSEAPTSTDSQNIRISITDPANEMKNSVVNKPRLPTRDDVSSNNGGKPKFAFLTTIPVNTNKIKIAQKKLSAKCAAYAEALNFMKNPARYGEFLPKFAENPSFDDRKSIYQVLDSVWNLASFGICRTSVCSVIQKNKVTILADLKALQNGMPNSSASSSLTANLSGTTESSMVSHPAMEPEKSASEVIYVSNMAKSETVDDRITPVSRSYTPTSEATASTANLIRSDSDHPITNDDDHDANLPQATPSKKSSTPKSTVAPDVENGETSTIRHLHVKENPRDDKSSGNKEILELITTTLETTFKAVKHLTETMAKKDKKKKKKKEKKRKKEKLQMKNISVRIIPPTRDGVLIHNESLNEPVPSISSDRTSDVNQTNKIQEEYPAVDLTDGNQIHQDNFGGSRCISSTGPTDYQASSVSEAPIAMIPQHLILNSGYLPVHELATNGYFPYNQCLVGPSVTPQEREFFQFPVQMQPLNLVVQNCERQMDNVQMNVQPPLQNVWGMNNEFLPSVYQTFTPTRLI